MPSELNALPWTLWLCAAATMSGRASWIAEWRTNAARLTGLRAVDDVARVVDEDQVADLDVAEAVRERVDPEVVRELRVASGDVPGHALAEADPPEDPQRAGELLLAVQTLLLDASRTSAARRVATVFAVSSTPSIVRTPVSVTVMRHRLRRSLSHAEAARRRAAMLSVQTREVDAEIRRTPSDDPLDEPARLLRSVELTSSQPR